MPSDQDARALERDSVLEDVEDVGVSDEEGESWSEVAEQLRGDVRDQRQIRNETLRLACLQYSIETQVRIETLLWVLGHIDNKRCPSGVADDQRVRDLTNRGPWPFDPELGGEQR